MAINPDIRDQAYQFFVEEARDLLDLIEAGLLNLTHDRSPAVIHSLMRSAHSLKGGAAGVGLDAIATIAHRLENIFKALYSETLAADPVLESWLLRAYDCLRLPLMEQIVLGSFDVVQALTTTESVFGQLEEYCGDALKQTENYIPSSTEMGTDMVASIFEVDVAQGLIQIETALAEGDPTSELQIQAEVFAGFAEILNLPNFAALAHTVQQALLLHPDQASTIAQLALVEFEQSRRAVLAGNREGGAVPSAALLRFAGAEFDAELPVLLPEQPTWSGQKMPEWDQPDCTAQIWPELIVNLEETFVEGLTDVESEGLDDFESDVQDDLDDNVDFEEKALSALKFNLEETFIARLVDNPESECEAENLDDLEIEDEFLAYLDESYEQIDDSVHLAIDPVTARLDIFSRENIDANTYLYVDVYANKNTNVDANTDINTDADTDAEISNPAVTSSASFVNPDSGFRRPLATLRTANAAPVANLTVRVESDRLEHMNNLVGELAINRSSLSLQNDQLQRVIRTLRNRFARFQHLVTQLQSASDQMNDWDPWLVTSASHRDRTVQPDDLLGGRSVYSTAVEFDALEMDRYGTTHMQMQTLLEDLVQLEEAVDDIALFARQSNYTLEQQQHQLTQLRDELLWARMLPLSEVLNRFPRILRDLAVNYQKLVQLKLTGAEVLVDRAILEKLYDPLLHLLRNAFDHGIEPPDLRQQLGKAAQGQIEIRAFHQGNQTVIEVQDNGRGIDVERIRVRIQELRWLSAEQAATLSPAQLTEFIFEPGFSTTAEVNELSGRGVGLDVVRSQLQALRSTVHVTSVPEQGTTFTLTLPLTLTITQLIVCLAGSLPVALPADSIEDILIPATHQMQKSGTQLLLHWRDQYIPVYLFAEFLQYTCPISESVTNQITAAFPAPKEWAPPIVVIRHDNRLFGLAIERVITEQELVIKPFGSAIAAPDYLYGCTILGDGSPVPVVDAGALLSWALEQSAATIVEDLPRHSGSPQPAQAPTVLVVDDAVMLRRTLALFLEREGFRVLQAQDGQEAIQQLQQSSVQLVVCDIEMPNMNGFEFLNARRQYADFAKIPVMMLTSRSNDKHRWLALQLGATHYFTKPYLEQEFLAVIKETLVKTAVGSSEV